MPIPSSINDLSTTAGSNSPAGTESVLRVDDYFRTHAAFIARLRDRVASVRDFGAVGDGVTDDSAAIQAAIDSGATEIYYPKPTSAYLVGTPLTLASFQRHSGFGASITSTGTIFTHTATTQAVVFDGLFFKGTGRAFYQDDPAAYSTNFTFRDCQFSNEMDYCVYGNFLLSLFENNLFGANFGTLGAQNVHLVSIGTAASGNATNQNIIRHNRFYRAKGTYALFLQYGSGNTIAENDFEECTATPVYLDGAGRTEIRGNWFENNSTTYQIILTASASITFDIYYNRVVDVRDNNFLLLSGASNTAVFSHDANSANIILRNNLLYATGTCYVSVGPSVNNSGFVDYGNNNFKSGFTRTTTNLVSNGDATNGTTGWTATNGTVAAVVGGGPNSGNYFELTLTGGTTQYISQTITGLSVGKKYTATYYVQSGTSGNESFNVKLVGSSYTRLVTGATTASWVQHTFEFMALDTFATIQMIKNTATAGTMRFGEIVLSEKIS